MSGWLQVSQSEVTVWAAKFFDVLKEEAREAAYFAAMCSVLLKVVAPQTIKNLVLGYLERDLWN